MTPSQKVRHRPIRRGTLTVPPAPGISPIATSGSRKIVSGRATMRPANEAIVIDSMFQDSSTTPDGGRVEVHEYHLTATADPGTGELLHADPRVPPYAECPLASLNVGKILGTPLSELRTRVR